jgi:hypothetical protein
MKITKSSSLLVSGFFDADWAVALMTEDPQEALPFF